MKYGKVWVSTTPDCGENQGGYYCMVYSDEDMTNQIDDFCTHPEDCDCTNLDEIEKFIEQYVKMYQ